MSGLTFTRKAVVVDGQGGIRGEVREYGRIANTATALDRLRRKLGDGAVRLRFCHEAGPCGYGIQRHLARHGHERVVVAPSLIPKRVDDRIKTDRRDAASLARLHRAGEGTAVWVLDPGHEAMRGLGARPSRRGARVALGAPATGFLLVMRACSNLRPASRRQYSLAKLPDRTLAPVVAALQTMRNMARVNAATLIAELGDLSRFANPRQLMGYLVIAES
jgi:transposase